MPHTIQANIRHAAAPDITGLQDIELRCFNSDLLAARQMRYHLGNPRAVFLVCEAKDHKKGALAGYALFFTRKQGTGRLYSVVLDPQFRGRGWARAMIESGIKSLRQKGIKRIYLEVDEADIKTITLYEQLGFKAIKRLCEYYADGRSALKMRMDM